MIPDHIGPTITPEIRDAFLKSYYSETTESEVRILEKWIRSLCAEQYLRDSEIKKVPILCYVEKPWAYFTTQPLRNQCGDDWEDSLYQYNSGPPYEWQPTIRKENSKGERVDIPNPEREWEIVKIAFDGPFEAPSDCYPNSFSVREINTGIVPWLKTAKYECDVEDIKIFPGVTLSIFVELIYKAGGKVYKDK